MADCSEEMAKIKERFDTYITRFNDKFFSDDVEKIKYRKHICLVIAKSNYFFNIIIEVIFNSFYLFI